MSKENSSISAPSGPGNTMPDQGRAIAALVVGAAMWGSIWFPYRLLNAQGVGGLWSMFLSEAVATLVCTLVFWRHLGGLRWSWMLIGIGFFAGLCNVAYIVGMLKGEIMRVTLLLYLSPLWTVILSHWLLGERLNRHGVLVIVLALSGALVMLWHPEVGAPWPSGLADWLGLISGVGYATYNVLVRKAEDWPVPIKSFVAVAGTVVVAGVVIPLGLEATPAVWTGWMIGILVATGVVLFIMAPVVQYGLVRLPANRAIVILLSELVFAALTAWWLAGETMGVQEWVGGGLIAVAPPADWPRGFAETMGWLPAGPVLLRLDVAERIAGELGHLTRKAPALLPGDLASRLGIKGENLGPVLDAMGFRLIPAETLDEKNFGPPAPARIGQQRAPRFEPRQHQGPRRDDRRPDRRGPRPDQRQREDKPAEANAAEGATPEQARPEQQRPERRPDQRPDRRPKPEGGGQQQQQQRQQYGHKGGNDRPRGPRPPREDRVALPPMPRPDSPFAVLAALKLKKD